MYFLVAVIFCALQMNLAHRAAHFAKSCSRTALSEPRCTTWMRVSSLAVLQVMRRMSQKKQCRKSGT